jgi:Dockerin type I domain
MKKIFSFLIFIFFTISAGAQTQRMGEFNVAINECARNDFIFQLIKGTGFTIVLTDTLDGTQYEKKSDIYGAASFFVPIPRVYRVSVKDIPAVNPRSVSITDLAKIRQHLLGEYQIVDKALFAADLNDSGTLTTADFIVLAQYLQGKEGAKQRVYANFQAFRGEKPFPNNLVSMTEDLYAISLIYIIKGDVDGSGCP